MAEETNNQSLIDEVKRHVEPKLVEPWKGPTAGRRSCSSRRAA
jgi:hypothetical protein